MDFLKVTGIILVCIILVGCVPTFDKSIASLIAIATCIVVITYIINISSDIILIVKNIISNYFYEEYIVLFKVLGISIITQFVSDIAIDSGNKALANQMLLVGKFAIVILSLPFILQVLEIIGQIIK